MLRFDGIDDFLEHSAAICTSFPYTMFVLVAAPTNTNSEMACIGQGSTTADAFQSGGFRSFGELRYVTDRTASNGSITAIETSTPHISATVPRWLIVHFASASDRRVAFGDTTFVTDTTATTSSIADLNRCNVGVIRRSSGLLHFADANLGEAWWCTGLPSNTEINELIAYTRLPEDLTGRVDGWTLATFNSGGTYTSHTGTRTMTASGGVSASSVTHPISRGGDVVAPILSSPTGAGGVGVCSGTVVTDEGNGTLFAVATASATQPTVAQIKAGQDHTGASALRAVSQSVTATGTQTIASGAITGGAGTRFWHYLHTDAAANDSNRISSTGFTVTAPLAVSLEALVDETGSPRASYTVDKVWAIRISDNTLVATWTNQTTNGSGIISGLTNAGLTAVPHAFVTWDGNETPNNAGAKVYTPS